MSKHPTLAVFLTIVAPVASASAGTWYALNSNNTCIPMASSPIFSPIGATNAYQLRLWARQQPGYGGTKINKTGNGNVIAVITVNNLAIYLFNNLSQCNGAVQYVRQHDNLNLLK